MIIQRPDIKSKEELLDELKTEWINMVLYASDTSFLTMKRFIGNPNKGALNELIMPRTPDLHFFAKMEFNGFY